MSDKLISGECTRTLERIIELDKRVGEYQVFMKVTPELNVSAGYPSESHEDYQSALERLMKDGEDKEIKYDIDAAWERDKDKPFPVNHGILLDDENLEVEVTIPIDGSNYVQAKALSSFANDAIECYLYTRLNEENGVSLILDAPSTVNVLDEVETRIAEIVDCYFDDIDSSGTNSCPNDMYYLVRDAMEGLSLVRSDIDLALVNPKLRQMNSVYVNAVDSLTANTLNFTLTKN
jgi:hypothetical protein